MDTLHMCKQVCVHTVVWYSYDDDVFGRRGRLTGMSLVQVLRVHASNSCKQRSMCIALAHRMRIRRVCVRNSNLARTN
jgi:hypothetical protein